MGSTVFPANYQDALGSGRQNAFMADVDIGEMFLNFIIHRELRALAGVDLSHYFERNR
jgi:hypothetical protein